MPYNLYLYGDLVWGMALACMLREGHQAEGFVCSLMQ
jgi:hypothetical protein